MATALHRSAIGVALFAACVSTSSTAGVINNVLIQWRGVAEKCEDPRQRDFSAMLSVAMFEAINATAPKYTPYSASAKAIAAPAGSSPEAAAARAAHDVLALVCPDQKGLVTSTLKAALDAVTDKTARDNGEKVGAQAAAAVIAARADSKAEGLDPVNAAKEPGRYLQTTRYVGTVFSKQKPWIMRTADETRPAAPPALTSEVWARDLDEVRRLGAKKSKERTADQTDTAKFWAQRSVRIVVNQLVGRPGRSLVDDARFLALADMAWADSYVAMMDAKYHYQFWRPITAIRHADIDGNPATAPDLNWEPLTETPFHPEYTCGHCCSAAAVGTVIAQEFGNNAPPLVLETPNNLLRRYDTPQAYIDDVSVSRIHAGVHYRFSLDAGRKAGVDIGNFAAQRFFKPLAR